MPAITDDDLDNASFGQLLNGTNSQNPDEGAQAADMSSILNGASGPSFFERGQQFMQENPMLAQAMLGTFVRMAQGGNLGQSVAAGAQSGVAAGIQQQRNVQQKFENDRKLKQDKLAENADKRAQNADTRAATADARAAAMAPLNQRQVQAQTAATEAATARNNAQAPLEQAALSARIAAVQQQIASSRDATQTAALQRQLLGLQILDKQYTQQVEQQFGAAEKQSQIDLRNAQASRLNSETEVAKRQLDMGAKGQTLQDYINKNADIYMTQSGTGVDVERARKDWMQIQMSPEQATNTSAARVQAYEAAKNAVPVGGIFTFEGKTLRRTK